MRCDETVYFFDSWGFPHETCEPSWHGAQAFGPAGTARALSPSECPHESAFEGTGLVVTHDDEWSVLDGHTVETDVVCYDGEGRYVVPGQGAFAAAFIRHAGSANYPATLVVEGWEYDPTVTAAGLVPVRLSAKDRVLRPRGQ